MLPHAPLGLRPRSPLGRTVSWRETRGHRASVTWRGQWRGRPRTRVPEPLSPAFLAFSVVVTGAFVYLRWQQSAVFITLHVSWDSWLQTAETAGHEPSRKKKRLGGVSLSLCGQCPAQPAPMALPAPSVSQGGETEALRFQLMFYCPSPG